jgi:hypothetical protein
MVIMQNIEIRKIREKNHNKHREHNIAWQQSISLFHIMLYLSQIHQLLYRLLQQLRTNELYLDAADVVVSLLGSEIIINIQTYLTTL